MSNNDSIGIYNVSDLRIRKDYFVTLQFKNWNSDYTKLTFLRSYDNKNGLYTETNVVIKPGSALPDKYLFKLDNRCSNNNAYISYGDSIKLYSYYANKFGQCAAGTCSLVDNPNDCDPGKWENFTINSVTGKTGIVNFNDIITISQTTGDNAEITAAGGGAVWATKKGTNQNAHIVILPDQGTIYQSLLKYTDLPPQYIEGDWNGDWSIDSQNNNSFVLKRPIKDNNRGNIDRAFAFLVAQANFNIPSQYYNMSNIILEKGRITVPSYGGTIIIPDYIKVNVDLIPTATLLQTSTVKDYKCFTSDRDTVGIYNFQDGKITSNTPLTFNFINWKGSNNDTKTFLRSYDNKAGLYTENNTTITPGKDLENRFIFFLNKQCSNTDPIVQYGEQVKIYSLYADKYIQCAAGTCSIVVSPNDCDPSRWENFTINSLTGKTGPICLGDQITISQTTGDKAEITAGDSGAVLATKKGTNQNAQIKVLPSQGTLYNKLFADDPAIIDAQYKDYKCFNSNFDSLGSYNFTDSKIYVDTPFTLKFINWISGPNKYTFLKSDSLSLRTDDSVVVSGSPISNKYYFSFRKQNCKNQSKTIIYGDIVQLYSVASNAYSRCAAGTCSLATDSQDCGTDKWETFTITSPSGKIGPVCFGDKITIAQTVGNNAEITAAGGGSVWATAKGSNINAIMNILPIQGTIYTDPIQEQAAYNKTVIDNLCALDPLNIQCASKNISTISNFFGTFLKNIFSGLSSGLFGDSNILLYIVIAIVIFIIIFNVVFKK